MTTVWARDLPPRIAVHHLLHEFAVVLAVQAWEAWLEARGVVELAGGADDQWAACPNSTFSTRALPLWVPRSPSISYSQMSSLAKVKVSPWKLKAGPLPAGGLAHAASQSAAMISAMTLHKGRPGRNPGALSMGGSLKKSVTGYPQLFESVPREVERFIPGLSVHPNGPFVVSHHQRKKAPRGEEA